MREVVSDHRAVNEGKPHMRLAKTATGKSELIVADEIDDQDFEQHAQAIIDRFEMTVVRKIDGPRERMWIVEYEGHDLCVSWDDWFGELTIMAWQDTPDELIQRLYEQA
jgi:hypothetical protein